MTRFISGLVVIFLAACAHVPAKVALAEPAAPRLAAVDVFGTDRLTPDQVKAQLGSSFETCIGNYLAKKYDAYFACKVILLAQLQANYHFAYLDLSLISYFHPGDHPVYATFDAVEPQDSATRLDFVPRPKKLYADPDGLIQSWDDYQTKGFELLARGELNGRPECPAFHCIFGHQHPDLKPYEKIFVEGVQKNRLALIQIFRFDAVDNHRAVAAFLLAYEKDGKELVSVLSERLRDESSAVRNNVTRVLADVAGYHPELELPIGEVIKVLNLPATTDRNKAADVIWNIVQNPAQLKAYCQPILHDALPILKRMLALTQPNNHDFAMMILQKVPGSFCGSAASPASP